MTTKKFDGELRELAFRLLYGLAASSDEVREAFFDRPLHVTACLGGRALTGCYVICVSGAPPRGMFVVPTPLEEPYKQSVVYLVDGKVLRLTEKQTAICVKFLLAYQQGNVKPRRSKKRD